MLLISQPNVSLYNTESSLRVEMFKIFLQLIQVQKYMVQKQTDVSKLGSITLDHHWMRIAFFCLSFISSIKAI